MKKFLVLSFMLIGLAFTAVGFTEPDVNVKDHLQVEQADAIAYPLVLNSIHFDFLTVGDSIVEVAEYDLCATDKPRVGYVKSIDRPPAPSGMIFKISTNFIL